jgi:hypothetical protein
MNLDSEKEIAEHALADLQRLRRTGAKAALSELIPLALEVANQRVEEHERADAWLAVCRVRAALESTPNDPGIAALWDDAIVKTKAWYDSF